MIDLAGKISAFNPGNMSDENLKKLWVRRRKETDLIVENIRHAAINQTAPPQQLVIAPRGYGKTHLMSHVYLALTEDKSLKDCLTIARLKEEEHVHSYLDFLRRILNAIDDFRTKQKLPKIEGLKQTVIAIHENPDDSMDSTAEDVINSAVGEGMLVILMENLGDIFDGLEEKGQSKLRAFLQTSRKISLLCSAQKLFEPIESRNFPFYGFFERNYLEPFDDSETLELLKILAEINNDLDLENFLDSPLGRSRTAVVCQLTSGNPRLILLLAQFLNREKMEELTGAFMQLVENCLTPYYQEQMVRLSPLQKRIIEVLCEKGDGKPQTVKEISKNTLTTTQSISSQLKKMQELGILNSNKYGRFTKYEMAEPLWRVSIEAKNNVEGVLPIVVEFIKIWKSPQELWNDLLVEGPESGRVYSHLFHAFKRNFDELPPPIQDESVKEKIRELCDCLPDNIAQAEKITCALKAVASIKIGNHSDKYGISHLNTFLRYLQGRDTFGKLLDKTEHSRTEITILGLIMFTYTWAHIGMWNEGKSWDQDNKATLELIKFNILKFVLRETNLNLLKSIKAERFQFLIYHQLCLEGDELKAFSWLKSTIKEIYSDSNLRSMYEISLKCGFSTQENLLFSKIADQPTEFFNEIEWVAHIFFIIATNKKERLPSFLDLLMKNLNTYNQKALFLTIGLFFLQHGDEALKIWKNSKNEIFDAISNWENFDFIKLLMSQLEDYANGDDSALNDFPIELRSGFEETKEKCSKKPVPMGFSFITPFEIPKKDNS
ncbi:MAG: hypothetical protein COV66_07880 [Nitrospinae bacterium CG11_big_fil_rev_8_21_14_0_20_45_15]|nr:MAG: hypothetical protein COV66_07880 [Nitrospinae bacterium CG11_big_fil_rev_8_21_14_0_20_45_15]